MVPRPLIAFLIVALCVLLVGFAVLVSGYALADGLGDPPAARVLGWIAVACLLLWLVALVLLVIALGLNYLHDPGPPDAERYDHLLPPLGRHEDRE